MLPPRGMSGSPGYPSQRHERQAALGDHVGAVGRSAEAIHVDYTRRDLRSPLIAARARPTAAYRGAVGACTTYVRSRRLLRKSAQVETVKVCVAVMLFPLIVEP